MSTNVICRNVALADEASGEEAVRIVDEARILVVSDDDAQLDHLLRIFGNAGFASAAASNITDACDAARSGQFQVIVTVPSMRDGSWHRLVDVANLYEQRLEVILLASNFDLTEWAGALNDGAFDVLNVPNELPNAAKVATSAFWAAYLRGSRRLPQCLSKLPQPVPNAA